MRNEDIVEMVRKKFECLSGVLDERDRGGYEHPSKLKPSAMVGKVSLPKGWAIADHFASRGIGKGSPERVDGLVDKELGKKANPYGGFDPTAKGQCC